MASVAAAAAGLPAAARQAGRRLVPAVPVVALVVAWLGVMLSLPQLLEPDTASGPGDMALPAVQAYVPDYLPGRAGDRPGPHASAAAPSAADAGTEAGGTDMALVPPADDRRDGTVASDAASPSESTVKLAATSTGSGRSPAASGARPSAAPVPALVPAVPAVLAVPGVPAVPAVVPVSPLAVASPVSPAPIPDVVATVAPAVTPSPEPAVAAAPAPDRRDRPSNRFDERPRRLERQLRPEPARSMPKFARPDIASLRSRAREESDGRTARRETRRRHTDHAQSA